MKKPTLIDVGNEAGVSAITVSRALRSPEMVSDSMRKKVWAAVEKLGYVPNAAASTLASSHTNAIVVFIPSLSNQVFTDVLSGLAAAIEGTKFTLQFGITKYDPKQEERLLRSFLNPRPAGVILAGVEQTKKTKELLEAADVPVVQVMDLTDDPIDKVVGFSHEQSGYDATTHLLDQGYQNVGFIGAQMDPRSQKRFAGYKRAISNSTHAAAPLASTTNEPSSVEMGAELYQRLVNRHPECDAVFCNNDDLALGVLFECQRRGIRVPEDFGICGFNDLGITSQCLPTISTVSTPLFELGRLAGDYIKSGEWQSADATHELSSTIVPRDSSTRN